ncbi:MAG: ribonuclease H-like domain-containing protein [Proteobacteria bacterium]|nr:ribonuclease H-like domain-containing protein [Pseudomonadota bacterium]
MKHKDKLFVFDIETVVDVKAARNLLRLDNESDEEVLAQFKQHTKDGFPKHIFHQVVAISYLEADIKRIKELECYAIKWVRSGKEQAAEKELVQGFFDHLKKINARLVSFNGRTFDMPALKYRAILHGIPASWLYNSGDKWNNYNYRYSSDWHCDMMDALTDFGAARNIKLDEACAVLGLPGKMDISGAAVSELYAQGRIEEIRNYCEQDILNTYLLYLRYALHTGVLSKDNYDLSVKDLIDYIDLHSEAHHLGEFKEVWLKRIRHFD